MTEDCRDGTHIEDIIVMHVHIGLRDHLVTVVRLLRARHLLLHNVRQQFSLEREEALAPHQEIKDPLPQQVHMTVQQATVDRNSSVFS